MKQITVSGGIPELGIFEKHNEAWVSSRDLAKMFGKEHKHIIRDIEEKIIPNIYDNEFNQFYFELSKYKDKSGKKNKEYLLNRKLFLFLKDKYEFRFHGKRMEKTIAVILEKMFTNTEILKQYKIGKYRVDFYFPDLGIIVEYDEKYHEYIKDKDEKREKEICDILKRKIIDEDCYNEHLEKIDSTEITKFIRIKEGFEIEGIREFCKLITEHRMMPCSDFM